jgi:hypothetical protein
MPTTRVQTGDLIGGRFTIEAFVQDGGMGSVYRGLDRETGRAVALKLVATRVEVGRFTAECRLLAELSHPVIVRYVDHGSHHGTQFLAMEWIDGETLEVRLARSSLSVAETVDLVRGVASGLAVAHARGIVHRDIKPSNLILIDADPAQPKLLDFGIARWQRPSRRTRTGTILGTVGYMAPEQARGLPDIDARADIFALGCVAFECLTGEPAFLGVNIAATLAKLLLQEAPDLGALQPGLPGDLSVLVGRMLAKDRERRPADASAVLDELRALADVSTAPAGRAGPVIGHAERRLLCVVLARGIDRPAALGEIAHPLGGETALLADGTALITFATSDSATDLAAQGAACALTLSPMCPGAALCLATGQAETSGTLPVGPVIDRAAALLEELRAQDIAIDDVTAHLLDARFEVRGHTGSRRLIAKLDAPSRRTLLGKQTPFVGRDKELALLEATVAESFHEATARAVLVTAPAGVGKSRLGYELLERLRRAEHATVLIARADPMSAGSSLAIARQLVCQAAGLVDGDPPARQLRQLATHLSSRGSDALEWLAELVRTPSDAPSPALREARNDPQLMLDRMQRAFVDWLAAECAARPVLITLEDLHWGDASSAAWLTAAMHELADRPLMILAFGRPEVRGQFASLWTQEISLGGLTRRAIERLVRAVLGDVPADVIDRIAVLSEGNAYYLEELIRQVAEGGADELPGELPGTILAMMQSRLGRLEPDARRVLRAASVFGETFWEDAVAALLRGAAPLGGVSGWLDSLTARELVYRTNETRFSGHPEYAFRHSLLRQAAYSTLTDDDRTAAHLRAGAWLEAAGEKDPQVIAHHLELGRSRDAVSWLVRAAQTAFDTAQFDAFRTLAERVLALGAEGELLGRLRQMQARGCFLRNEPAEAMAYSREAIELLPRGSVAWCYAAGIATITTFSHKTDPSIASHVARSVEDLVDVGSDWPFAWALSYSVWVLFHVGHHDDAIRLAARVERLAAATLDPDPMLVIFLHTLRALVAFMRGDAGVALREARSIVTRIDDRDGGINYNLAIAVFVAIVILLNLGAFDELGVVLERPWQKEADLHALGQFRALGRAVHQLACGNAALLVALGERFVDTSNVFMNGAVRAYVAQAHLREGRPDLAEAFARPVVQLGCSIMFQAEAQAILARVTLAGGRPLEALALIETDDVLRATSTCPLLSGSSLRLTRVEALLALQQTVHGETTGEPDVPGDRGRPAVLALAHARDRILRVAASMDADADRMRFLDDVPDHRRTLELASQLLGSPPPIETMR